MDLHQRHCKPCEGGIPAFTPQQAEGYLSHIKGWGLSSDAKSISKNFAFIDFKHALGFVNEVGDVAEFEGHHPDISLHSWNKVAITLSTHALKGLSENDFILAAKIDQIIADAA